MSLDVLWARSCRTTRCSSGRISCRSWRPRPPKENKSKLSRRKKGAWRHNKLYMHLNKRLMKRLRKLRSKARNVTTRLALALASQEYRKLDAQKEQNNLSWPVVARTGKPFEPNFRWMQLWFSLRSWSPRRPSKKRATTAADDSANMQKYCDKLLYTIQMPPDQAVEPHAGWGYFPPAARFNRDQIGFAFDFICQGRTWAALEEKKCGGAGVSSRWTCPSVRIWLQCLL